MSVLSEKGGQAMVGNDEFAPTKPDNAFDRPAIVKYRIFFSPLFESNISRTFAGSL